MAALTTRLSAHALLAHLHALEIACGRVRGERNAPRLLDLDLLLYGEQSLGDAEHPEQLVVPHPRLHLRAFVVIPLYEIAPDLRLPGRGALAAWLPAVANQGVSLYVPCA